MQLSIDLREDHVGPYATMAAFFFMMSLIPIIILMLALVQYLPATQEDVLEMLKMIFPGNIDSFVESIVYEVYQSSIITIPLTIIVALWGAGRGIMALARGLNCVHDIIETRNYIWIRIRATIYTLLVVFVIVCTLVLQVFGIQLADFVVSKIPITVHVVDWIVKYRTFFVFLMVALFVWAVYCSLPNKKVRKVTEIPGAVFTAIVWVVWSWIVSKFTMVFKGFTSVYGSLTMIILFMLWISVCMMILLIGSEVNMWFKEYDLYNKIPIIRRHHDEREEKYIKKVRKHNMDLMKKQLEISRKSEPGAGKKAKKPEIKEDIK